VANVVYYIDGHDIVCEWKNLGAGPPKLKTKEQPIIIAIYISNTLKIFYKIEY